MKGNELNSRSIGYVVMSTFCFLLSGTAMAHGGGLNASGCHNNNRTGDYHCHRAPAVYERTNNNATTNLTNENMIGNRLISKPPTNSHLTCYIGPRGGTYTITPSGRKNYNGC